MLVISISNSEVVVLKTSIPSSMLNSYLWNSRTNFSYSRDKDLSFFFLSTLVNFIEFKIKSFADIVPTYLSVISSNNLCCNFDELPENSSDIRFVTSSRLSTLEINCVKAKSLFSMETMAPLFFMELSWFSNNALRLLSWNFVQNSNVTN